MATSNFFYTHKLKQNFVHPVLITRSFNHVVTNHIRVTESNSEGPYIYTVHLSDLALAACFAEILAILSLFDYSPRIVTGSFALWSGNPRLIAQNHRSENDVSSDLMLKEK